VFGNIYSTRLLTIFALFAATAAGLALIAPNPMQMSNTGDGAMQAAPADRPATVVKPLSCEKLADIPGKAVTTATVTFPPNAYTPAHRHPGSVTAYVLKGAVRSRLAGGPAITYKTGETWFEPTGALHLFAENASRTDTAEILAVFVTDENCGPMVIPEPSNR